MKKYKYVCRARHGRSDYRVEIQTSGGAPIKSRSFSVETNIDNAEKVLYWVFNKFSKLVVPASYRVTDKPISNQVNILVYPAETRGNVKRDSKWMTIYHMDVDEAYDFITDKLDTDERRSGYFFP